MPKLILFTTDDSPKGVFLVKKAATPATGVNITTKDNRADNKPP